MFQWPKGLTYSILITNFNPENPGICSSKFCVILATRWLLWHSNCKKIQFWPGLRPRLHWRSLRRSPDPVVSLVYPFPTSFAINTIININDHISVVQIGRLGVGPTVKKLTCYRFCTVYNCECDGQTELR